MFKFFNKGISTILIIILILIIVGAVFLTYKYWWLPKGEINNIACTMEAKLCPDGSAVGRTGPNCEFAQCPVGETDKTVAKPLEEIVLLSGEDFNLKEWDIQKIEVGEWGDSKLILINKKTNEEKTFIDSTFELRNYMEQRGFFSGVLAIDGAFFLVGSSGDRGEIYFIISYEYSGPLFSLNINSLELREIKEFKWFGTTVFSPEGDRAVSLGEYPATSLYLICFNTDTKMSVLNLKEEETLEEQMRELDSYFNIKWLDEKNIEYKVYKNEIKKFGDINNFIETRTLELPDC